ncbi:MAG: penicillin acylase family protein, partial [Pyrinomonadaceae bacterium]
FSAIAEENLKYLSAELRAALESYARGVNAYIAALGSESLPQEFKIFQYRPTPWRASDTIVIGKILSDALSTTWRNDLLRASLKDLPKDKFADLTNHVTPYDVVLFGKDAPAPGKHSSNVTTSDVSPLILAAADQDESVRQRSLERVGLYAEDLAASNNWVIAGRRTATGKPILANDPHLMPTAPGIWYLTHLTSPGMRVSGVTFPGVPGIILGHNESIAWGATNVGPDVQDLYIETFDDNGRYKTPTGWEASTVRTEAIKVRTNPLKPDIEAVSFKVVETRHGPIITEQGDKKYSLKWTAFDPHNTEFDAFYKWNRARNWTDFKDGVRSYGGAAQNFIFADVKGNIGWYAASRIPIRRTGDGALPYDGSTNEGDWIGDIPFDELPNLYNPPSGLIVTANQRIVGTSYKYTQLSRDAASPWRARRIADELKSRQNITMDDVRDVQYDSFNIPVSALAKEIVKRGSASAATINVLKAWDGRMTPDSHGALLANEIRVCMGSKMGEANPGVPAYLIRERVLDMAIRENAARWLPANVRSYDELMSSCDTSVRADLTASANFGPDPAMWVWGKTWQSRFPHPLADVPLVGGRFKIPSIPISGSGQTPNVGSAVSMRHIASPGDWDATRHVIPLGQSGDPASPHYKDQFDAWRTGAPAIFPFTKAAVEKAAVETTILSPR